MQDDRTTDKCVTGPLFFDLARTGGTSLFAVPTSSPATSPPGVRNATKRERERRVIQPVPDGISCFLVCVKSHGEIRGSRTDNKRGFEMVMYVQYISHHSESARDRHLGVHRRTRIDNRRIKDPSSVFLIVAGFDDGEENVRESP